MTREQTSEVVNLIHILQSFGWVDVSSNLGTRSHVIVMDENGVISLDKQLNEDVVTYEFIYDGPSNDYTEMNHLWDTLLESNDYKNGIKKFGNYTIRFINWGKETKLA